ncbi:hypothetical protein Fuma_01876 [Fuerstiella marisgermanici]|uniref:Uncharacterized protein n=1 Tax=Fuerstiella marisgermanici TaxID=1891926 RepID=A0A1P8WDW5_9PLAN|nr:hypothetical protein Fuma_01876 [Fuerstiella marisgermanici]
MVPPRGFLRYAKSDSGHTCRYCVSIFLGHPFRRFGEAWPDATSTDRFH